MTKNRFNVSKLRLLAAIDYISSNKELAANSKTISKLTGMGYRATLVRLSEHNTYFNVKYDTKKTDGCHLVYSLNKKGVRRLNQLLDRFANGHDLKLQKKPEPYDWSGFVLLPGLEVNRDDQNV